MIKKSFYMKLGIALIFACYVSCIKPANVSEDIENLLQSTRNTFSHEITSTEKAAIRVNKRFQCFSLFHCYAYAASNVLVERKLKNRKTETTKKNSERKEFFSWDVDINTDLKIKQKV